MSVLRRLGPAAGAAVLCFMAVAGAQAAQTEVYVVNPAFTPINTSGRTATVKGIGFSASTTVAFDGVAASTVFIDSRTIIAFIPTGTTAKVTSVQVSDPVNGDDEFFPFLYTGPALYVATTGDDGNPGTNPALPKLTLAAALADVDGTTPTEIRVAAGDYVESQLAVEPLTVLSCGWAPGFGLRDPDIHVTAVDGNRRGFILRTQGLENVSVIDGCTFRNGLRDGFGGGGLPISADSAVVNNNVIAGNISTTQGGGIYFRTSTSYGGRSTFSNNVIVGNKAYNKNGGGIVVYTDYNTQQPVQVNVTNNRILGNRSRNGRGGGFSLTTGTYGGYNTGTISLVENQIEHNRAKIGAGIDLTTFSFGDYFHLALENNLIAWNSSEGSAAGLVLQGMGTFDGRVIHDTVAGNAAPQGLTGGLLIDGATGLAPTLDISDLILWDNVGGDVGGLASLVVTYSDSGTPLPGPGNISADPAFVAGPLSDHYLRQSDPNAPDSPAVDAGSGPVGEFSLDALTTRADGVKDAGTSDMGYHHPAAPSASLLPLVLNRVDPQDGHIGGGDWVLVRGDGFDPGIDVEFNGVPATKVVFVNNRRALAELPAQPEGFASVRVTNPDATTDIKYGIFLYKDNEPPVWSLTKGVVSATSGVDACQRTVILDWSEAVDLDSPPVFYEIYREKCEVPLFPGVPCDNFGYIPNASNFIGLTTNTSAVDPNIPGSQNDGWVYAVRARDSAAFGENREYNFAKKHVIGTVAGTEQLPEEVGDTLGLAAGTSDTLAWGRSRSAVAYGVYRETDPSQYATPGSLTKLATLDGANNDLDGDGVVDPQYVDPTEPAPGQAFYYKITALDSCAAETTSEL